MDFTSVGFDCGHNRPPDTGAVGVDGIKEDKLTKDVGAIAMKLLREEGIRVVDCCPPSVGSVRESLQKRVAIANAAKVDLFCSIHFNAFNNSANGTEVFAISETGRAIAASVLKSIVKVGSFNRGVKNGNHLFVVKNTAMPAILVEFLFCDSAKDMELYDPQKLATLLVEGILEGVRRLQTPSPALRAVPSFDISFPILRSHHAWGDRVEKLQALFNLPVDGFFDENLENAVKEKQRELNVAQSGCVDNELWLQLF